MVCVRTRWGVETGSTVWREREEKGKRDDRLFDFRKALRLLGATTWLGGELFLTEGHSFVLVDKPKGKEHDCVGYTSPLKQTRCLPST